MLYSFADIAEHLLLSENTVRGRIKRMGISPKRLKPNNTNFFTAEQVELIKENMNYNKQVANYYENIYYIYESKMNDKG